MSSHLCDDEHTLLSCNSPLPSEAVKVSLALLSFTVRPRVLVSDVFHHPRFRFNQGCMIAEKTKRKRYLVAEPDHYLILHYCETFIEAMG